MSILATAAIVLRLWMRYASKTSVGADDILVLLGVLAMFASLGVLIWGIYAYVERNATANR